MKKCLMIVDARSFNSLAVGFGLALTLVLGGCTSSGEDDASLEADEPVEATPQDATETTTESQAPSSVPPEVPADAVPAVAPDAQPSPAPIVTGQPEAQGSGTMMNTSKRVLYVKVESAVLREQPEAKSKIVGKASRGDHFLVSIEGDWAKTEDGKYISMKVLSERGVGRQKKAAGWGQAQPEKPKKKGPKKGSSPKEGVPMGADSATDADASPAPSEQGETPAVESK